eukprot:m.480898 g.480898  ORF g.480898 m.480898 type:complete len:201 (-) comp54553_c0_seq1:43-645(-)
MPEDVYATCIQCNEIRLIDNPCSNDALCYCDAYYCACCSINLGIDGNSFDLNATDHLDAQRGISDNSRLCGYMIHPAVQRLIECPRCTTNLEDRTFDPYEMLDFVLERVDLNRDELEAGMRAYLAAEKINFLRWSIATHQQIVQDHTRSCVKTLVLCNHRAAQHKGALPALPIETVVMVLAQLRIDEIGSPFGACKLASR